MHFLLFILALGLRPRPSLAVERCKATPADARWPSELSWADLNNTLDGALINTIPAATSCYADVPVGSPYRCDIVESNWTNASFHAALPESVDYPIFANNSCLPSGAPGYLRTTGCSVGGYPAYVVNATTEHQIAKAMRWASEHDLRIVIKGTGHDMHARSSGAHALSIWTHNFKNMDFVPDWVRPGTNETASVLIAGSGLTWGLIYPAAQAAGRCVVGGEERSVGLGGFIQGGGHGPLSSHYGLAADNLFQATVVTSDGTILIANEEHNPDLLWAIRGGQPGQYGVVTEFIIRTHPAPTNVVWGKLTMGAKEDSADTAAKTWMSLATFVQALPDIMDRGFSGSAYAATGLSARGLSGGSSSQDGVFLSAELIGWNTKAEYVNHMVASLMEQMELHDTGSGIELAWSGVDTFSSFTDWYDRVKSRPSEVGQAALMSSRLLGREQLKLGIENLATNLQMVMRSKIPEAGAVLVLGLQGGIGPAMVPKSMRGALNPAWRTSYVHAIVTGASIDTSRAPQSALRDTASWVEENKEKTWQQWAPRTGAYMNEANPYSKAWKNDFYGPNHGKLLHIKHKYDPTNSLFVLSGVDSDTWSYDMGTGRLCMQETI